MYLFLPSYNLNVHFVQLTIQNHMHLIVIYYIPFMSYCYHLDVSPLEPWNSFNLAVSKYTFFLVIIR